MKLIVLSLLFAAVSCFAVPEIKLNGSVTQTGVKQDGKNWILEKKYPLLKAVPQNAELALAGGNWKLYKKAPHICGYNGVITVKLQLPDFPENLTFKAGITNFSDSRKRTFLAEYSLNGTDYQTLQKIETAGGTSKLQGKAALKGNGRLLFLRFRQVYADRDTNGRSGFVVFRNLEFTVSGKMPSAEKAAAMRPKRLKEVFPTGVFWPWERTEFNGKYAGMELWQHVEHTMKLLKENGYDTAWMVNFNSDKLKFLNLAEKHGIKVLFNARTLTYFYHSFSNLEDIDAAAKATVAEVGHSPALLGHVLKDEPLFFDVMLADYIRKRMLLADPDRDSITVTMNRQTPTFIKETGFPVICSDMYYFFAPHSIQGPNTPEISKYLLSNALYNSNKMAEMCGKNHWFMGMIFQSIWGRYYIRNGKIHVLPGAYLHWRLPTPAETRWQVWEGLRNGSKGIFFYVLYGPRLLTKHPDKASTEREKKIVRNMDAAQKSAASWKTQKLTDKPLDFPTAQGMIEADGTASAQMKATASVTKLIRKNEKYLLGLKRNPFPAFFPKNTEFKATTFVTPDGKELAGIIVNHNCDKSITTDVLTHLNVKALHDLATGRKLPVSSAGKHFKKFKLTLKPGDGVVLKTTLCGMPGIAWCSEEFDNQSLFQVNLTPKGTIRNYGEMGFDMNRAVCLKEKGKTGAVAILNNLYNAKAGYRAFTRNLNTDKKGGAIYCLVEGSLEGAELRISGAPARSGENYQHLKIKDNNAQQSNQTILLKNRDFHIPAVIPPGTRNIEFHLTSHKSKIDRIFVWYAPGEKDLKK